MDKKELFYIGAFTFFLIFFAIFSTKIQFHDVNEYITVSKALAGINNINVFTGHSSVYPAIISLFLRIWPSFIMLRLVNVLWLLLSGLILFFWLKNKKAFIIYAFSPIVWHISIQTTPVLPASFFFLLAFIFFKKDSIKYNYFYSGFFLGLSFAIYTPMLLVAFFFMLIYFWNKNFSGLVRYLAFFLIGFLPRLILDFYLYGNPVYTLIRYCGANFIISLGMNPVVTNYEIFYQYQGLLIFVLISPFLFRLYKLKWGIYKKEILFFLIIGSIFLIRAALIKYFIILTPLIIVYLSSVLSEREVKWHCIISLFLILFLTYNYFTINEENIIESDLKQIISDYKVDYLIAYPINQAQMFASLSWDEKPRFVWFQDFNASLTNKTKIRGYDFSFNSKIPLKESLVISASFNRFDSDLIYENYMLVSTKDFIPPESFKLERCYNRLCIYSPLS
ncbi:MAG: hypothetical protein PHH54_05695 [Candidatus Nanoarchaeia archaeon]|nr:hypothetical protein [Candidatus Nanoarchaeia archaeon]MDD5741452.1 hypothetical protein [Candidatus Nanoarchaeia archaeon]